MDYNLRQLRHRAERAHYPHHESLRVDQTLSWLYRDKSCENGLDGQYVFLWIVFNAAYAQELACLNVSEAVALWGKSDGQTSTHHFKSEDRQPAGLVGWAELSGVLVFS
jgi:hypothetical protein